MAGAPGFDPGVLYPASSDAPLDEQFWSTNIDPTARYCQSPVGSMAGRPTPDGTGIDGLVVVGDWVQTGLGYGCIEAAVMGGLAGARAITGDDTHHLRRNRLPAVPRSVVGWRVTVKPSPTARPDVAVAAERRFLPAAVRALASANPVGPAAVDLPGIALVADLVGFTPTVLRLDGLGRRGHAALTELLDRSYSAMDSIIADFGGQTLVRIGDATVAVFPGDDPDDVRRRARQAAHSISQLRVDQPDLPSLRVGLAAGLSQLLLVPVGERRVWTLIGDPPALAAQAQTHAAPDSVYEHESVAGWHGPAATWPVDTSTSRLSDLLPRALAGETASTEWLGEVRPLTVLFCQLSDEHGSHLTDSGRIVDAVAGLHRLFVLGDAPIDQLIWDEKGLQIAAMFGTQADRSPEHAPLRAVDTALRSIEAAAELRPVADDRHRHRNHRHRCVRRRPPSHVHLSRAHREPRRSACRTRPLDRFESTPRPHGWQAPVSTIAPSATT